MVQYFKYYRPGLGQSWLLAALMFLGSIVVGFCLPRAPQSLTYFLSMLLPLAWCWWMGQQAYVAGSKACPVNDPHFGKIGAGRFMVLALLALLSLTVVADPTTSFIPMPDTIRAMFERVFMDSPLWDMVLSTCILAPLLEEFLCRGMMLRGMLSHMSPRKAIIWSAVIFAVMHMNPWQSIPALLIGLLLGWVYWRTHCLWATIFLHCFNNSLSTLLSRLMPDIPVDASLQDLLPPTTWWIVFCVSVVVLTITLYILHEKTLSPEIQAGPEA